MNRLFEKGGAQGRNATVARKQCDSFAQPFPLADSVPPCPVEAMSNLSVQDKLELKAWLADPSLFWLHPEGPLSDTTPDEWLAKLTSLAVEYTIENDEYRGSRIIGMGINEAVYADCTIYHFSGFKYCIDSRGQIIWQRQLRLRE